MLFCAKKMFLFKKLINEVTVNNRILTKRWCHKYILSVPEYDIAYLTNPVNIPEIEFNIQARKGIGDIKLVHELFRKLGESVLLQKEKYDLFETLQQEMRKIPNKTHPEVLNYGQEPKDVKYFNEKPVFDFTVKEFSEICRKLNILRTEHLGNFTGHKSYFLMSDLAELEQALIEYATEQIFSNGFDLISVPDILPEEIIESCGMTVKGDRTQVYRLQPSNHCLSGTSEMAIAGFYAGKSLPDNKPIKIAAVSRCFRAETSGLQEEKGIYRVHQFTKVEMFSVCNPEQSEGVLEEFKKIEIEIFKSLGLHFKLLDMPPHELGAPAYRKYDIEVWMPARKMWGEISSCSNCTDYQSRRLNIRNSVGEHAHTVNGTACAIPRMLIAILENYQNEDGSVDVPMVLRKYLGKDKIVKRKIIPELKLVKSIPSVI